MESNIDVEFSSSNKNCWDLFKELSNSWIKNYEMDNHNFLGQEGLQLAGPSAFALSLAANHVYPVVYD